MEKWFIMMIVKILLIEICVNRNMSFKRVTRKLETKTEMCWDMSHCRHQRGKAQLALPFVDQKYRDRESLTLLGLLQNQNKHAEGTTSKR